VGDVSSEAEFRLVPLDPLLQIRLLLQETTEIQAEQQLRNEQDKPGAIESQLDERNRP
jgi:hypothetical protein